MLSCNPQRVSVRSEPASLKMPPPTPLAAALPKNWQSVSVTVAERLAMPPPPSALPVPVCRGRYRCIIKAGVVGAGAEAYAAGRPAPLVGGLDANADGSAR